LVSFLPHRLEPSQTAAVTIPFAQIAGNGFHSFIPRLYRLAPLPQAFHYAAVGCFIRAFFGNAFKYNISFAEYTHMLHIICYRFKLAILEWRILCY
jgi:hypothetical protein